MTMKRFSLFAILVFFVANASGISGLMIGDDRVALQTNITFKGVTTFTNLTPGQRVVLSNGTVQASSLVATGTVSAAVISGTAFTGSASGLAHYITTNLDGTIDPAQAPALAKTYEDTRTVTDANCNVTNFMVGGSIIFASTTNAVHVSAAGEQNAIGNFATNGMTGVVTNLITNISIQKISSLYYFVQTNGALLYSSPTLFSASWTQITGALPTPITTPGNIFDSSTIATIGATLGTILLGFTPYTPAQVDAANSAMSNSIINLSTNYVPSRAVASASFTGYALEETNGPTHPGPNPLGLLNPYLLDSHTNLAAHLDIFGVLIFEQNPTRHSDDAAFLTVNDLSSTSFYAPIDGSGLANVVKEEYIHGAGTLSINGGTFIISPNTDPLAKQYALDAEEAILGQGAISVDSSIVLFEQQDQTNCFAYAAEGAVAGGAFVGSQSCYSSAADGGLASGNFDGSSFCSATAGEGGSIAAAQFSDSSNCTVFAQASSFAGLDAGTGATNIHLNGSGFIYGSLPGASNVTVTGVNSILLVQDTTNYTATFTRAFGIIYKGIFSGFDGTKFIGNASGLTNLNASSLASGTMPMDRLNPNIQTNAISFLTSTNGYFYPSATNNGVITFAFQITNTPGSTISSTIPQSTLPVFPYGNLRFSLGTLATFGGSSSYERLTNFNQFASNNFTGDLGQGTMTNTIAGFYTENSTIVVESGNDANPIYVEGFFTNGVLAGVEIQNNFANQFAGGTVDLSFNQTGQTFFLPAGTRCEWKIKQTGGGGPESYDLKSASVRLQYKP